MEQQVAECAVVGMDDPVYGQRIVCIAVLKEKHRGDVLSTQHVREFLADKLPAYKLPAEVQVAAALARNSMGKVNKKALAASLQVATAA